MLDVASGLRSAGLCVVLIASLGALGCDDGAATIDRSCRGESVMGCAPYSFAVARNATLTPSGLRIGELNASSMFHLELQTCPGRTGRHTVQVDARYTVSGGGGDGGSGERVANIATLRDDGTMGDLRADDGIIDVTMPNPLGSDVPPSSDVELRFEPRLGNCVGARATTLYRTGARFDP